MMIYILTLLGFCPQRSLAETTQPCWELGIVDAFSVQMVCEESTPIELNQDKWKSVNILPMLDSL